MSKKGRPLDRIEEALVRAHRETPEVDLGEDWRRRLMAELKRQPRPGAPEKAASIPTMDWGGPILKFAGAAALAAVMVALYAWLAVPDLEGDFARMALGDPMDLLSLRLLGAVGGGVLL
ncbi:MAG: hypothetical protein KJ621_06795 [Proteobacteria bacterium]|nr:hypothetical protein [Pseudomonadota bacterium]MBU1741687.1 hypothetical protein [Pseudomonadota bacterium]